MVTNIHDEPAAWEGPPNDVGAPARDEKHRGPQVLRVSNQVTVRGEATGTPAGEFMGVPYTGKSFKLMSIDVHTLEGGKMVRTYHIEDWLGAVRQLSAK